jgi:hypothetical protein
VGHPWFLRFNPSTLQRFNAAKHFPRNLARDFLQYTCERPEMAAQQWKDKQAQKQRKEISIMKNRNPLTKLTLLLAVSRQILHASALVALLLVALLAAPRAHAQVEGSPEANDFFGQAVATGDFNGDGNTDLAIGVPGESIGSVGDAGG